MPLLPLVRVCVSSTCPGARTRLFSFSSLTSHRVSTSSEEAGLLEHGVEHVVAVGERFRSTVLGLGTHSVTVAPPSAPLSRALPICLSLVPRGAERNTITTDSVLVS